MELFDKPRDGVFRDFTHERRLDLRATEERFRLESDFVQRILKNPWHQLQETRHMLIET